MAAFFRYLVSLLAHSAWQRTGKGGSLPHFKVPGKRTTRLPIPSPWQIMVVTWVLDRLWKTFGDDVKYKLTHTKSPAVNHLAKNIPAPGDHTAQPAQPAQAPAPVVAPQVTRNTAPSAAKRSSARYDTQRLPQDPLPPGSVLGSLRSHPDGS